MKKCVFGRDDVGGDFELGGGFGGEFVEEFSLDGVVSADYVLENRLRLPSWQSTRFNTVKNNRGDKPVPHRGLPVLVRVRCLAGTGTGSSLAPVVGPVQNPTRNCLDAKAGSGIISSMLPNPASALHLQPNDRSTPSSVIDHLKPRHTATPNYKPSEDLE